ncbi:THUMP domain-containing class I SAM-dependent methyltransferase [Dictyobacter kobayashii]|uniref:RNA methyltransferase n=1 Tax=Dictyobacter kobayashii TaxID=2014872 RepID=A0A402AE27_9CHLR|nr:THUMP domain-containing class I SAM-dependent methyltransferase [Dictyobacter kobayashii]GCE17351.1 RNA methyltransferase [Dictyobacter kobayashii]
MSDLFYAMTMPGLETLAFSEIRATIPETELVKFMRGIALFRTSTLPENLLDLHTTEDVFATLAHIKGLRRGPDALRVLHSATLNADLSSAVASWRRGHHGARPRTWRVVSQMTGSYDFRRMDAGQAVTDALRKSMPRSMRLVEDDADLEIWLWLGGGDVLIGVRLSDATMRHRQYKREHIPASLRPTVAASMGWLARPTAEDIVLDPLCGAGTILIERALLGPVQQELGGDLNSQTVNLARRNARSAEVDISLKTWDARSLPLEASSVTRIITNLPFGKQIGTREENEALYTALIREFDRVLAPKGLMVSLTSEDRLWDRILQENGWRTQKKVVFVVLGQPASIFVSERA